MFTTPNFTDSYFGETVATDALIAPLIQTPGAILRLAPLPNHSDNSVVLLGDTGDISNLKSESFQQLAAQPLPSNTLWVSQTNSHIYFDGTDLMAGGGSGDVIAPPTRTANTIPTWFGGPSYVLNDGTVSIDNDGNIGIGGYPASSLTFQAGTSNPGGATTLWVDNENGHLTYGDNEVVQLIGAPGVYTNVPIMGGTPDNSIKKSGFSMPEFGSLNNLLFADDASLLSDDSPYAYCTYVGANLSNNVTISNPATTTDHNTVYGNNLGYGLGALELNCGGNTLIGTDGFFNDGSNNVCVGNAIMSTSVQAAPTNDNVVIGSFAGNTLKANGNVIIGREAARGLNSITAEDNIVIGLRAFKNGTLGSDNLIIGVDAVTSALTTVLFQENVVIGHNSMGSSVTDASGNVVIGIFSLDNLTSGGSNTALGSFIAENLTTGSNNVLVGRHAGKGLTTGSGNIIIGNPANTSSSVTSGGNNILINSFPTLNASDTISIGNTSHTQCYMTGIYNVYGGVGKPVYVNVDGQLYTETV